MLDLTVATVNCEFVGPDFSAIFKLFSMQRIEGRGGGE